MMRVPLAKKELKGMRAAQRAGLSGGAMLDDFADDVADLVKVVLNRQTLNRPFVMPIPGEKDGQSESGKDDAILWTPKTDAVMFRILPLPLFQF